MQDSRFATFRQRCVEWVYGVAHAIHLDKHGAWCAIAIMDKFSTEASAATSNEADSEFRLTTKLTCLCAMMISSKVNGCGRKMTPVVAAHLSAGLFSVQQVLQHECDVMGTLSWDVNFISPYEAIHFLVPHIAPPSAHVVVAEVAEKMIDGARAASPIIGVSAVVSACAAVHIALQHCDASKQQRCRLHLAVVAIGAGISTGEVDVCAAQLDLLSQGAVVPLNQPRVTKSPTVVNRTLTSQELLSGTSLLVSRHKWPRGSESNPSEDGSAPPEASKLCIDIDTGVPPVATRQAAGSPSSII
jgi:hypothetical protein